MAEMDHYIAIVATSHIHDYDENLAAKSTEHNVIQSRLHDRQLAHEATKKDLDLSRANEQHTAGSAALLQQWVDDLLVELDDSKRAEHERVDKLQASVQEKTEAIQAQRTLAALADEERAELKTMFDQLEEKLARVTKEKKNMAHQFNQKSRGLEVAIAAAQAKTENSKIELNKRAGKIESLELELSAVLTTERPTTDKDTSILEQKIQALIDQNVTLHEKDEAPQLRNDLCCMTRMNDGLAQELAVSTKKIRSLESDLQVQQRTITTQTSLLSDRERRIQQLKALLRSVSALRPQ
ncbi:hypothetical protein LTR56_012176 [Elasticomyces elasticus]|nr:hypothetical protein LTR56_012176 [Elasticomyces elasticus]KAK3663621.1 hypothetical protein LTR22_005561 [Elasticomyces elasticus]KAK4921741.1 hypothetical protein LTR49_010847 [Elasticomyces elasticus]KAK5764183.1 hypothetical protein LTS12_005634 [Elasticomyces elasticus]